MVDFIGRDIGRYHVLEQLGMGGMAIVYKAYDPRLERDVAVKVIRVDQFAPAVLERVLKRFEREAKALAKLSHTNIVGIIDYGEYKGTPYLVMPYLSGGTLRDQMGGPMPWADAIQKLLPIAHALDYAHRQGMVHRDVKPTNILFTSAGDPMLTDFGIAKILETTEEGQTLTESGVGIGTPPYMSPEQGMGQKDIDGRSDVYSLGVVLYELITGCKPYEAITPQAVLVKQMTDPLPRPRQYVPDLPEEVERVLFKALANKPENRYQSMGELITALKRLAIETVPESRATLNVEKQKVQPQLETEQVNDISEATTRDDLFDQPAQENGKHPIKWLRWVLIGLGILVAIFGLYIVINKFLLMKSQEYTQQPIDTKVIATSVFTKTNIPVVTPSLASTLGIGSNRVSSIDGMVEDYVPAGTFLMGAITDNIQADSSEMPQHTVMLDAFWIDQTLITNKMYAMCVAAGKCTKPHSNGSASRSNYYDDSEYADYPVINVKWEQASAYCNWAGRQLPTEAEWEKAALGTDGHTYPWGYDAPDASFLNFNKDAGDTTKVGSYPLGASPYGALDMEGNVWEWVADWYDKNYYSYSPSSNPTGPTSGEFHVLRGSSWFSDGSLIWSAFRSGNNLSYWSDYVGFRCASSQS